MARIVIKDLPESIELDQQALKSVIGGSRLSGSRSAKKPLIKKSNTTLWGELLNSQQEMLR